MLTYELATARAWMEVDVDSILFNYRNALRELSPGVAHFTVLKANAYGAGAVPIAKILYGDGARLFAVSCASEAMELSSALPRDADILIMGITMPAEMDEILRQGIMPTVCSYDLAEIISQKAAALGVTARVHCKIDTGLHRLGFALDEAANEIAKIDVLPNIQLQSIFSHLQRRSPEHDRLQGERLKEVRAALAARGVAIPMCHLLDSIGMWRYPENQMDAVRDAAFIIGHTPKDYPHPENLRFALSLKTRIVRIHTVLPGECISYDAKIPLDAPKRVATLSIGYADGYPRAMSHVAEVEIRGQRAKILGVVCMDLMIVDVTDIEDAAFGDEVTLLGGGIDIWTYTGFSGGYNNEYISMIGRRIPRVYLRGGQPVEIVGYLHE